MWVSYVIRVFILPFAIICIILDEVLKIYIYSDNNHFSAISSFLFIILFLFSYFLLDWWALDILYIFVGIFQL